MGKLPDTKWWRDAAQLQEQVERHGSFEAASLANGGPSARSLQSWWKKLNLPPRPPGPSPTIRVLAEEDNDEALLQALKKAKDKATVEELADLLDVAPRKIREGLERLGQAGYRVEEAEHEVVLNRVPPPSNNVHKALFKGETVRFGVVSDTHLGSKHERLDELHMAYQVFKDEGIDTVYHPGDLVCGKGIFPGQLSEVNLHSYEEMVEYAIENYPQVDGITTHIIAGNHDLEGEFGKIGANPVIAVCNQRKDIVYGGDYRATYELEQGTRIYLVHPKGGMSYAVSYKVQKLCESFEAGSKPHLMLVGHYHRRGDFEWRGIQSVLCGTFEGGGSFGVRLGLGEPAVGFYVIEMTVADDGSVVRFLPEWRKFYPGREVLAA